MKKIAGIAAALFIGYVLLKGCMADPAGSAKKVNDAGQTVGQAGDSAATFFTALSGGTLLVLGIIAIAVYLGKKK
jgi:hypothetical protein